MTLTKDITAKFAVAAVAVAMIFSAFAPAAQAQTTEDLQQMINDLLEQVAMLQAQTGGTTGGGSASDVCPYTWTRDLTMGSEGADVMKLQQFLNDTPDLRVAPAGSPGSAGMETMYYGPATAAAVSKMQVMFRAEVLTPNGLVNPTGYFGPSSRAKANDLCVADATTEEVDEAEEGAEEEEEETGSMTLQGEGILSDFESEDEEDEVEEGAEDEVVATYTLEAEDGDIEIDRMYFTLSSDNSNTENDAYDVFEEVSVWVDGDKLESFDASDEGEYRDEDAGTFTLSGLGIFVEEDEEVEVLVAVSVNNTVRGSENIGDAEWTLEITEVRYFDADGVAENDNGTGDLGAADVTFDIVREGIDDDADIEGNNDTPDSATLEVEEDNRESEEYVVHVFDIEVDEDSSDLELNDAFVWVTVNNPASASTTIDAADVISDIFLTIDGQTETGDAVAVSTGSSTNITAGNSARIGYLFEFDELALDSGETYEAEVSMEFEGQDDYANFQNGVTIETDVDAQEAGARWEVEGANDNFVLSGTDKSELHTLSTVIPVITDVDAEVTVDDPNNSGTISFTFTIEVDGENDLVDFGIADILTSETGTDVANAIVAGTLAEVSGDATAGSGAGLFDIDNGDTANFALDFPIATLDSGDNGTYRVTLESILGVEVDVTSAGLSISQ